MCGILRLALANTRSIGDAAMTSSSTAVSSATAVFVASDVGKSIFVQGAGAGGSDLSTTIVSRTSATIAQLTAAASATVTGAVASWGTRYGNMGTFGFLRYSYGTPAINGVLVSGRPRSGVLRRMYAGLTNFELITTRLPGEVSALADVLRVPDSCVPYIKYGVLYLMFSKEGEQQDMTRAQYAKARYDRGIELFRKVLGVKTRDAAMAGGRK